MRITTLKQNLLLLAGLFLCSMTSWAQEWDEIVNDRDTYFYGIGISYNRAAANAAALSELTGKISVAVEATFAIIEDEKNQNGDVDATTYVTSKVSTYSTTTLNDVDGLEKFEGNEWYVLKFIKRDELNKIFEGRRQRVEELVYSGEKAESEYKVGDALKYYYWAFTLLKTIPYSDHVTYTDKRNEDHVLASYLPVCIENIFNDIRAEVTNIDDGIVEVFFTFKGHPAVNLEYCYWNGRNYSNICHVKDGRGEVDLGGFQPKDLKLMVEYAYRSDAESYDRDVAMVQDVVRSHTLTKSQLVVPMVKAKEQPSPTAVQPTPTPAVGKKTALVELTDDAAYREKAEGFISAIRSRNYHSIDDYFTPNGLEMYGQLLKYGTPRIYGQPDYKVLQSGDEVVVRSIPMSFTFKRGARKCIVEDVVLCFIPDGRIDFIAFALDEPAVNDILTKGLWSDTVRQTILRFLEDYKTAYCLERIDYLDTIFSDDALIIVGHVLTALQRTDDRDRVSYMNNSVVRKTRYTKPEYMEHLKACFNRNECINIHFAENDINKAGKGNDTFGIQIRQDYYSTTYGDSGWLFLVVDFNNPAKPIITTRVWQEQPDPEFGLVGLKDYQ